MQIFIKCAFGRKTYTVEFEPTDSVKMLREKAVKIQGMDANQTHELRLVYAGRDMRDHETLAECGVDKEATIHSLLRLRSCAKSCPGCVSPLEPTSKEPVVATIKPKDAPKKFNIPRKNCWAKVQKSKIGRPRQLRQSRQSRRKYL